MYDYLVVGTGLYGAVFAQQAKAHGKSVLVIDKRDHIAGNVYSKKIEGIEVQQYGAHIFHTNDAQVWNYVNQFAAFNRFTNSPVANYKGKLYSLPFNMYTFNQMWGVVTPEEAAAKIEAQRREITGEPQNLEEQAISLVGRDIYEALIKGYTESSGAGIAGSCQALSSSDCRCASLLTTIISMPASRAFPPRAIPAWWIGCWMALRFGRAKTIWKRKNPMMHWPGVWSIQAPLMPILATAWGRWNTALCGLKLKFWTSPIFRAMPPSTTRTGRHTGPGSSSTNGLPPARMNGGTICPGPSSAGNIPASGPRRRALLPRQ